MSLFDKFDRSEGGLQRLKEFLLRERPVPKEEDESIVEMDTTALLGDSFLEILQKREKANKKTEMDNDKENEAPGGGCRKSSIVEKVSESEMNDESSADCTCKSKISYLSHNDSTIVEEPSIWRMTTDESFENIEKMCETQNTSQLQEASTTKDNKNDAEINALNRLLNQFAVDIEKGRVSFTDVTQLNDVEAPSALWDNTISNETILQSSPVKMVGMLRPSTIFEESSSSCESNSSKNSYKTAAKLTDFTSTDQYETANETDNHTSASETKLSNEALRDSLLPPISYKKHSFFDDNVEGSANTCDVGNFENKSDCSKASTTENIPSGPQKKISGAPRDSLLPPISYKKHSFFDDNVEGSANTCDVGNFENKSDSSKASTTENIPSGAQKKISHVKVTDLDSSNSFSLISSKSGNSRAISEFDDSLNQFSIHKKSSNYTEDSLNPGSGKNSSCLIARLTEENSSLKRNNTEATASSVITVSDEENAEETDLNIGFSMQEIDSTGDSFDLNSSELMDHPPEFNDTIEEMEYIMQQGMKYMQKNAAAGNTLRRETHYPTRTPSPRHLSPRTPNTVVPKYKTKSPITTVKDDFKKPTSSSKKIMQKVLHPCKKQSQFNHIISPVAAYIKNTPKVPITSSIRTNHNVFESRAVRELDYNVKHSLKSNCASKDFPLLPRKAYVSAEYQHVVDDRKPVVVPGGEKIHRYLQSSKIPAVIKHEGKIKMNLPPENKQTNRTVDSSLADLSVMSGDVSVYVLRDAKR